VRYWLGFKDWFLETPNDNQLVGPRGREGGWGYLAGGRFKIAADEALLVTIHDGGAEYTGFQIADPWTMSPNPAYRLVSRNKTRSKPNAATATIADRNGEIAQRLRRTARRIM
jgi:hypothetical protein